jgi:hypothetical protein
MTSNVVIDDPTLHKKSGRAYGEGVQMFGNGAQMEPEPPLVTVQDLQIIKDIRREQEAKRQGIPDVIPEDGILSRDADGIPTAILSAEFEFSKNFHL